MFQLSRAIMTLLAFLLTSLTASAADMRLKAPPAPPPPPPFSWTGFYIGGNIGGAWAESHWTDSRFGLDWGRTTNARFMGGGQIGFNYQFEGSIFVLGAEAQFDWVGNDGGVTVTGPLGHTFQITSNDTRIATLAARFGFAAFDRALFYGKVGGGWVGNNGFTVTDFATGQSFAGDTSHTFSGWMAGAGVEYAFSYNWSMKFEYDFIGLGGRSFTLPGVIIPALAADTISSDHNVQLVKVGLNYRFNWGMPAAAPVMSKY
jgi:outer membrane immunogenic protein